MTGREIIESCCKQIMDALESGLFTRDDLEFLTKFFGELTEISKRKLVP